MFRDVDLKSVSKEVFTKIDFFFHDTKVSFVSGISGISVKILPFIGKTSLSLTIKTTLIQHSKKKYELIH